MKWNFEKLFIYSWPLHNVCNQLLYTGVFRQWRTEGGGWGVQPPQNSEGPPKSCQTQPDCENC